MEPIRLEYSAIEKLEILKSLSHFLPEEYPKIMGDELFWKNKFKLDLEFAKIKNGTAQFVSLEELETILEETFSRYDNK